MRKNSKDTSRERKGFALIVALGLMAFIVLLLLTTSIVVSLDMASLQQKGNLEEARDNARLGLLVALGELQKQTGPDKRVTATSSIFPDPPGGSSGQQQWVGVWNSAAWNPDAPTQQPDTAALFRKWLVSVPEGEDSDDIALAASTDINPNSITADSDWVALVDKGTLGEETPGGGAPVEDIVYGGKETLPNGGHYAYWVGDEGVKARYNLPEVTSNYSSLITQAFDLAAPKRWRIEAVDDDSDPATQSVFATIFDPTVSELGRTSYSSEIKMTASSGSDGEILREAYGRNYHNLTLSSMGLLTNTRDGGLKKDLSLAFELSDSEFNRHEDFAKAPNSVDTNDWRNLYTSTNPDGQEVKHLWTHESAAVNINDGHYKGPTWHLLRDYYGLYREVTNPTSTPRLTARNALPLPDRNAHNNSISNLYNNGQNVYNTGKSGSKEFIRPRSLKVAPVVARVQLLLSLTAVPLEVGEVVDTPSRLAGQSAYKLRLIVDPIVTLYNPYSVNLWFQGVTVEVSSLVASLEWEVNGVESNVLSLEEIFGISHPNYESDGLNGINSFGTLAIGAAEGITLAPGEVRVYSAGNESPASYYEEVDAIEGWPAEGGFYVDSLDPDPRLRYGDTWASSAPRRNYYGHTLQGGDPLIQGVSTGLILGSGADTVAIDFEPDGGGRPIWVSRKSEQKANVQMEVKAYLITEGAYGDRFKMHENNAFIEDTVQHYTTLRANVNFGESSIMNNIGRLPDENGTYSFSDLDGFKQSLGQIDLRLKTEDDQKRPYPMFAFSSMNAFATNPQSSGGGNYGVINPPFAVVREPVSDVVLAVQFNPDTLRAFWGPTRNFNSGVTSFVAGTDIPKAPLVSLGQLQHVDTAIYGYEPSHAIGNSFASPWLELDRVELTDTANIDMSFLSNNALWDDYYFSSIAPQDASVFGSDIRNLQEVLNDFTGPASTPLPNSRMRFIGDSQVGFEDAILTSNSNIDSEAYRKSAAYLGVDGAFNVNSTSVEAWKALYASLGDGSLAKLNTAGTLESGSSTNELRVSRFSVPLGNPGEKWTGYSTLSDSEVQVLAEKTVEQVKKRGPFLSMAQFVNRQVSSNPELAIAGALQTAINDAQVNTSSPTIIDNEISGFYVEDEAARVPVDTGATGFLTQADLLSMLGSFLTIRSDTFTIRAYGDVTDPLTGRVAAQAWCEAIVQRRPDYIVSDEDEATTAPYDAQGDVNLNSTINQEFGRQYEIIGFRWLDKDEV